MEVGVGWRYVGSIGRVGWLHTRRACLDPTKAGNRMRRAGTGAFSQRGAFTLKVNSVGKGQLELEAIAFEPADIPAMDSGDSSRRKEPQT